MLVGEGEGAREFAVTGGVWHHVEAEDYGAIGTGLPNMDVRGRPGNRQEGARDIAVERGDFELVVVQVQPGVDVPARARVDDFVDFLVLGEIEFLGGANRVGDAARGHGIRGGCLHDDVVADSRLELDTAAVDRVDVAGLRGHGNGKDGEEQKGG